MGWGNLEFGLALGYPLGIRLRINVRCWPPGISEWVQNATTSAIGHISHRCDRSSSGGKRFVINRISITYINKETACAGRKSIGAVGKHNDTFSYCDLSMHDHVLIAHMHALFFCAKNILHEFHKTGSILNDEVRHHLLVVGREVEVFHGYEN